MRTQTRYAKSGDVHIAYQVVGDGPIDLIYTPGWVSHLEYDWEHPEYARFLDRLASFSRLIRFDKRGTGLSDRVAETMLPTIEQRMDDFRAVMDATGSDQAALLGSSGEGPLSILFAATYPHRTLALLLYGTTAKLTSSSDYPWGSSPADPHERERRLAQMVQGWGNVDESIPWESSLPEDRRFQEWWATRQRYGASPGAALSLLRMNVETDVRHVLPAIHVPTLVMHRAGDGVIPVGGGRFLAERIAGAKYVEFPGNGHTPWLGESDSILDEIEEFLTGKRRVAEPDRVLATVLFTDIVGSTARAAALGDRQWTALLDDHHAAVRRELERFRGREIHVTGDGFLATFDGPARAIRCASSIVDVLADLGLEIRAGLHTGEIELMGSDIGGIAVHLGARVMAVAGPGEVLVSSTVKDLVAGSGVDFKDRGTHTLKGVPGEWRLFQVIS